jgi:hypothetical protein
MKAFVLMMCLTTAAAAHAGDWVVLASDTTSRTLVDTSSIKRDASDQVSFRIKQVFSTTKDMMGLRYDAAQSDYRISCQSSLVLFRQQFLMDGDEIVWTYPASDKSQKTSLELPEAVTSAICRTQ